MKTVLKLVLSLIAFAVASGVTYVVIKRWNTVKPMNSVAHLQDTLEGVEGLSEGETVTLPTLTTLNNENVNLGELKEERLLCVFIGSQCPGCVQDIDLWKDLRKEAEQRGVAFYLVSITDEFSTLEQFSSTYKLHELPLIFDPNQKVGRQLKVGFLPQYVLFTRDGRVIHRWDGIRHYNKQAGSQQLAAFFEPH